MLIFKTKKIISFLLLSLFLISLISPITSLAADPTITLKLESEQQDGQTGKWRWLISINTTNISNGTIAKITLYKGIKKTSEEIEYKLDEQTTEEIKNNYAEYDTKSTLDQSTQVEDVYYVVSVLIQDEVATFRKKMPVEGESSNQNNNPVIQYHTITPTSDDTKTKENYYPLAPLPGIGETCEQDKDTGRTICVKTTPESGGFGKYLNTIIQIFIGLAAVLSMIMIVMGGIEYMTSELVSGKQAGKQRILNAILGLVLALGSYAILNTLNPDLLNVSLSNLPVATITINGESTINPTPISTTDLQKITGIYCPGSGGIAQLPAISQSFGNHVTYNQDKRHTYDTSTIYLDCSSYVSQIYSCAGLASPGNTSADIFNPSDAVNSIAEVKTGDILGWKKDENNEKSGHVVMSLGGDTIIEVSNPPGEINKNAHINSLKNYENRIKYIKKYTGTSGTATVAEKLTSVKFIYGKNSYFTFVIDGFDNKNQYRYRIWEAGTLNSLISGTINKNLEGNILNSSEYNKIRTKKIDITVYNVSDSLIGKISNYQM